MSTYLLIQVQGKWFSTYLTGHIMHQQWSLAPLCHRNMSRYAFFTLHVDPFSVPGAWYDSDGKFKDNVITTEGSLVCFLTVDEKRNLLRQFRVQVLLLNS